MDISAVLELVCLDLSMHLASCWIHRPALVPVRLIAVGKGFVGKRSTVAVFVIGPRNLVRVGVALVDGLASELASGRVLGDRGYVMPRNATLGLVAVIDVSSVLIGDLLDFAYALRSGISVRRRAARILGPMTIGIGDLVDIPIWIVMKLRGVVLVLKIGVAL